MTKFCGVLLCLHSNHWQSNCATVYKVRLKSFCKVLLCSVKMAYVRISAANTIKQKYNRRRASAPVTAHHTVVKVRHQMHKAEGLGSLIMEFLTICSQRQNWFKLVILCVFLCIAIKKTFSENSCFNPVAKAYSMYIF